MLTSILTRKDLAHAREFLTALHRDERGDNENLGRLLILALILVPLVILIALFGDEIYKKAQQQWKAVMGKTVTGKTGGG